MSQEKNDRAPAGPRSLTRLLRLFDALSLAPGEGLGLADLNTILQSPKSSLLNLLRPLVATGYVHLDRGRYRLGPTMFRLSGMIMSRWNLLETVRPFLKELAHRSQESVYLGVLDKERMLITYVDSIDSAHSVRYSVPIGALRPLYSTAAGRVVLAYIERARQEEYIATTHLEARTPQTLTTSQELREELDRVRTTRVSVSLGENFPESAAIAAPIFGADGQFAAAIAIGGPTERIAPRIAEFRPIISDVAHRASGERIKVIAPDTPRSVRSRSASKQDSHDIFLLP